MNTKELTLSQFCDLHGGITDSDRFALDISLRNEPTQSYDKWHDRISREIKIGEKKKFEKSNPANSEK